jgi:hypothetical protein
VLVTNTTANGYPVKSERYDSGIGHGYDHETELHFYRILQLHGLRHVQDPVELMKSKTPAYTVNTGPILIPFRNRNSELRLNEWYPDAIIRIPGGNVHFVELKSHSRGRHPWKYSSFKRFFAKGKQEFNFTRPELQTEPVKTYLRIRKNFNRTYGPRSNLRFHIYDRRTKKVTTVRINGKTDDGKSNAESDPRRWVQGRLDRIFKKYGPRKPPKGIGAPMRPKA